MKLATAVALGTFAATTLGGCGASTVADTSSSSSASSSTSSSTAASTTTSSSDGSTTVAALSCRLPIAMQQTGSPAFNGGFITFPGGGFSADPASAIPYDASLQRFKTSVSPVLYGVDTPPTYSHTRSRWLPAPIPQLAPDSTRYAYSFFPGQKAPSQVHVVDALTGSDRMLYVGGSYFVLNWDTGGIYLHSGHFGAEGYSGLWLLDPDSGRLTQLESAGYWTAVGAGAAWAQDLAPGDHAGPGEIPFDRITRRDLQTGLTSTWFRRNGAQVDLLGFDGDGHPFVRVDNGGSAPTTELWRVDAPGQETKVWSGAGADFVLESVPLSDSHGTWFGLMNGVWLYHDASFSRVSTTGGAVTGRCV